MAAEEQLTLDGLVLNDSTFGLAALDMTPPRQRQEWIGAADSEWQSLVRAPLHENREITATIQILPQSTTNLAMDKIGQVVDKFRLASMTTDGIDLVWTPADGTRSVTFDCLAGEITGMPINWEEGWLIKAPTITLVMRCKPYWYGTEVTGSTASSSTPFVTQTVAYTTGDIPALGRLIVTDTATQSRRHVEWGLENQYYNAATSLLIDSDDMVTSGFAGTAATTSGAYDPNASGNNNVSSTISSDATAVVGTGNLSHVGSFRVKGRFAHGTATVSPTVEVRFAWQAADGPWTTNDWVSLTQAASNTWEECDLGTITVTPVIAGTQRWTGRIEARIRSGFTGTDTVRVDYLILVPTTEGYGKARGVSGVVSGVLVDYDQYTSTTAAAALNATTSDSGDTWATSGDATDYAFSDDLSGENVKRATSADTAGRYAVLGSATPTDVMVESQLYQTANPTTGTTDVQVGVIARWTDANNYVRGVIDRQAYTGGGGPTTSISFAVIQVLAGVGSTLASGSIAIAAAAVAEWRTARLTVYASGRVIFTMLDANKTTEYGSIEGSSSALATAGGLASGKSGLYDFSNATGITRYYDNFATFTPTPEEVALYSGRNMQFRHDETIRQDSTGTYTGRPPSYRGSRFLVPTGTSRVIVKARRNDVEVGADSNVTDATQIQIAYTPRGIAVPRS
jgi:hypothetical protein